MSKKSLFLVVLLIASLSGLADAKLLSSSVAQDKAKRTIEDIFRQTRINEGEQVWGDRYREEIARFSKAFSMNYYQIFLDLGISSSMARMAIYAKYESDSQRWLDMMTQFDLAAADLDPKDKSKYYFAKGLLQIQCFPDKVRSLPEDFYRAAENGYSSTFISEYLGRDKTIQSTGVDTAYASDVLQRLGESYERGGFFQEAYKFYLLSIRSGNENPDLYIALVEVAYSGGSEILAYNSALLFTETYSAYGGLRPDQSQIIRRIPATPGMSAEEIWKMCESDIIPGLLSNTLVPNLPDMASRPIQRNIDDFENRYIEVMTRSVGQFDDQLRIAVCRRYWQNPEIVKKFLLRIKGSIDSNEGAIGLLCEKVRSDPRFSSDQEIASWEARRWKAAKKMEEFSQKYPDRYKLAGSPR